MMKDKQDTIHTSILPELSTSKITWDSSSTDVVSVGDSGKITGKKEGIASIYAVAEGIDGDVQSNCFVSVWTKLDEKVKKYSCHRQQG